MTADAAKKPERPLSPFMIGPYYKPQLTSMLSILHRACGVFLSLGAVLLVAWLSALAAGPEAFKCVNDFAGSPLGLVIVFGFSYALMYHLSNGIRHLFWDTGKGFDIKTTYKSGYLMIASSLVLTTGIWVVAFCCVR